MNGCCCGVCFYESVHKTVSVPAGRGDGRRRRHCCARVCASSPDLRSLCPARALCPAREVCWWTESGCECVSSCGCVCCAGAGRPSAALTLGVAIGETEGRGWCAGGETGCGCESGSVSESCRCLSDCVCYYNYKNKHKYKHQTKELREHSLQMLLTVFWENVILSGISFESEND